jgi:hypothetical protein
VCQLTKLQTQKRQALFREWMRASAEKVGVTPAIFDSLTGTVFEVRQGYKSKDSKRQNADIANAATAYVKAYFPCAVILSDQIDGDILLRYRAEKWAIVTGVVGANDPLVSTYDFMRDVIGYDLAAFFERNSQAQLKERAYRVRRDGALAFLDGPSHVARMSRGLAVTL